MLIKILLVVCLAIFTWLTFRMKLNAKQTAFRRLGIIGFFILAFITIIFPELSSYFAHLVGVGRGTDLLLYLLILVYLFSMFVTAKQRTKLQKDITILARRLAIQETISKSQKKVENQLPNLDNEQN